MNVRSRDEDTGRKLVQEQRESVYVMLLVFAVTAINVWVAGVLIVIVCIAHALDTYHVRLNEKEYKEKE